MEHAAEPSHVQGEAPGSQDMTTAPTPPHGPTTHSRGDRLWASAARWFRANTSSPSWLPQRWSHPLVGYVVALLLQGTAVWAAVLLIQAFPLFPFPGLLAILTVPLVALSWGTGPSIVAALVGALLLDIFTLPPFGKLTFGGEGDALGVLLFLAVGLVISAVASQSERTRRHAQATAARLDAIITSMADGVAVYDRDGRILLMNAAMRQHAGIEPWSEQYYSRPLHERAALMALRDAAGHPLPEEQWPTSRVLRGEVLQGATAMDTALRRPDGRLVWLNLSGAPLYDVNGRLDGAVTVSRDVTERRRLEQYTQQALQALLAMAEALVLPPEDAAVEPADAVVTQRLVELARRVLDCHHVSLVLVPGDGEALRPLAIAGLTTEQAQRWRATLRAAPPGLYGADPSLRGRLEADEVATVDMRQPPYCDLPNPSGAGWVLVAPLRVQARFAGILTADRGGDARAFAADEIALARATAHLATLVIERARLQSAQAEATRLAELERLRSQFIGAISHDLQTPLTALRAELNMLNAGANARLDPDERVLLRDASYNVERLRVQIADLLTANQLEAGALHLCRAPLDLRDVAQAAARVVQPLLREKGQTLDLSLPAPMPLVGDARRLEQVVVNLLANAQRHTPKGTRIGVRGWVAGATTRLVVHDDGPGIAPEALEAIFTRFYRRDPAAGGSGLGLANVRAIVEMHGGRVWAERPTEGGAAFHVALPLDGGGENDEEPSCR